MTGYRAARVRAIFELPPHLQHLHPDKLVYIDWMNNFPLRPAKYINQFTAYCTFDSAGKQKSSVVPLSAIHLSCHLAPDYGSLDPAIELEVDTEIFALCRRFYLNDFGSYFIYELMRHWMAGR
jgi:hypothetical protein